VCEGVVAERLFLRLKEPTLLVPGRAEDPIEVVVHCAVTIRLSNHLGRKIAPWHRPSLDLKMKAALAGELRKDGRPFWE